jgi:hypothetical protein
MPSQRTYSITEPHPSATPRAPLFVGRGGAGNLTRAPQNVTRGATASGPPSRLQFPSTSPSSSSSTAPRPSSSATSSHAPRVVHSGRGGVGNVHPVSERAIFSFDEELERHLSRESHAAPVYHVGRGGAGNVYAAANNNAGTSAYFGRGMPIGVRRANSESSDGEADRRSEKSVGSVESGADVATKAMRRGLRKVWGGL